MIKKLTRAGLRHVREEKENQDVVYCGQNEDFCVISLADGVSSCSKARSGAEIASREITRLFTKRGGLFLAYDNEQIAELVLSHIVFELSRRARQDAERIEEYSSTVASVLIDKKHGKMLCVSLGDSLIMAVGKERCHVITMPADSSDGCHVTTTEGAAGMTSVKRMDTDSVDSVVIFSDGAWRQMYDKNRLRPEVEILLDYSDYEGLKKYLDGHSCPDDYSFISTDMGRKSA